MAPVDNPRSADRTARFSYPSARRSAFYFTQTADQLPSFTPGHQAGSNHHHTKHGVAALLLGLAAWIDAWMSFAPEILALRCRFTAAMSGSSNGDRLALQQQGLRPEQGGDVGVEFAVHDEQVGVLTRCESAFAGVDAACDCRC